LQFVVSKEDFSMHWTTLTFGRHAGRSLPEIILSDVDWFFWALNNDVFQGKLANEAEKLAQRATAIKIPRPDPRRWQVEYCYDDTGGFCGFSFVKADISSYCGSRSVRWLPYLDLSYARGGKAYDKRGCRNLLRDFRCHYFGKHTRLTKRRCKEFFSNKDNFLKASSKNRQRDIKFFDSGDRWKCVVCAIFSTT
jgi:hypothetical protein